MKTKHPLLIILLFAALLPWAATAQTPNLYTSYTATAGISGEPSQEYPCLVDNNINTKWCVGDDDLSGPDNLDLYIEFYSAEPIIPTGYVLTTGDDNATFNGRNPKDWTIKAKANPNDEWTTIATVINDQVLQDVNLTDFAFTVNNLNLASYQYFRFDVSAIQSGECFQLAELRFIVLNYTATAGITDNPAEGYPYLVDNDINTKWCIGGFSGPNNLGLYIEFYSSEPIIPTGYVLTTANDNATWTGRNPKDWTIKAKANPNDEWTTIATVTNDQVLQDVNFTDFAFTADNPNLASYQYFRFDVTAIQSGTVFQLAELRFMVADPLSELLYFTNFESQCDWTLVNGSCTNKWCWGTAAHNGTGTHGLYISNDGGTTNAYTNTSEAMVYAYKTLDFEAGIYGISYDWKANGIIRLDFLRVALVPAAVSLSAGTALPSGFDYNALPAGWIALDGGLQLNMATDWQTASYEAMVPTAGQYKIVFAWRNTGFAMGTNPPAAIDNVSIEAVTCPTPHNFTVGNVSATTANLNWTGISLVDNYTVKYRTARFIDTVFAEDFGHQLEGWTLRNCVSNTDVHYGEFIFYYTTNPPQYLISPELTGVTEGMKLEFEYRNGSTSGWDETFQVGFSTTNNANASFTFGEVITASGMQWHRYSVTIPAGTKYICWKHTSNNQYILSLDNIVVGTEVLAGEWQTSNVAGNATEVSATLTGLTPATLYDAFVFPDCNPDNVSQTINFTTQESCPTPTNLTAGNIGLYTADLSWTGLPEVDSYTVTYKPVPVLYEDFENFAGFGDGEDEWTKINAVQVHELYGYIYLGGSACLISPELPTDGLTLGFYCSSPYRPFQIGYSSTDKDIASFTFGDEIPAYGDSEWHLYTTPVPTGTKYICWKILGTYGFVNIDDIMVCPDGYDAASEWQTQSVAGNAYQVGATLTGLAPGNLYEAYVYPDCNPDKESDRLHFMTAFPIYASGFESVCSWTLVNGDLTNKWTWGTAAHNGEGTHGLYISNDGGTTNAYTNTDATMVYAYKTFNFEADVYRFSYDWIANGESYWDFLRVALVPATVSLSAGTALPEGFNYIALPEGWIALDGGSKLNMATDWQTASYEVEVPTAGEYMMVFAWRNNDGFRGINPPAAIDNVFIDVVTCPTPVNLTVSNRTATTANLSWSASMPTDSYTVNYRTAPKTVDAIFSEGFEDGLGDWTLRDCDSITGIFSYDAHSGSVGFRFYHRNTNPPQYLISPQLSGITEGMRLEFYYKNATSYYPEIFQVGFSTTNNATESFTFGDNITASDEQWHLYSETIPAGTKYICWKYNSYDKFYLLIDDIAVGTEIPAGAWQTATVSGNATEMSTTLTGLTPATFYEAHVYPDCDPDNVSETVIFTTKAAVVTQTIALATGWNWFSTYLEITLNDLKTALVAATPGTNITIKAQDGSNTKYTNGNWRGPLNTLDVTKMYRISVANDCEITLQGSPINPTEYPVTIDDGINWIGFPLSESMSITNAFFGFPYSGDQVKSQSGTTAKYTNSWRPNFDLVPGQGYIYKSNLPYARTLFFHTTGK